MPQSPYRTYICYRSPGPIVVDGDLHDTAWEAAPRSDSFVDILGDPAPAPPLLTHVRMLWDDRFLYVAGELEEPHVWGTLTERDAIIFRDDDFEVFVDPDGDTHRYVEIEINALNAIWDLFLPMPYRDGGTAVNAWDMRDLRSGVMIHGTINDPSDVDQGWSIELAIPWEPLAELAPGRHPPRDGDRWRMNFSRVDWDVVVEDGAYQKVIDPTTGSARPEHNWVWSPQGAVNMHMPERWGTVQFSDVVAGSGIVRALPDHDESTRHALREVYYAERAYFARHGRYTSAAAELDRALNTNVLDEVRIAVTPTLFEAWLPSLDGRGTWRIRYDGRVWRDTAATQSKEMP